MKLAIALIILLWGCAKADQSPEEPLLANLAELQAKRDFYLSQQSGPLPGCDSLLFTSLTAVGGMYVDIGHFKGDQGEWYRTPAQDCYATGRSKSTISKDMLLGLAWYLYWSGIAGELEGVLRYGREHLWVMGEGVPSRTVMTPSLQAVYAKALYKINGKKFEPEILFPQVYLSGERGFTAHLQVLNILLMGAIDEGIGEKAKELLSQHRTRNPSNGLFCFAYHKFHTGDMAECIGILSRENLFPSDRLPNSGDRCEPWLWQREIDSWDPCPEEGLTHSGGELIFVTKLIENYLGQ